MGIGLVKTGVEQRAIYRLALHAPRAGIEQQFRRVKAVPLRRLPRAMHAVTVALARFRAGKKTVPDIARARREIDALLIAFSVEQAQLHALSMG